jgi:hypothetical protein
MKDEEFETVFEKIEEIYELECLAEDGIPAHLYNPEYRESEMRKILEEIYQKGYDACDECKSLQR